eukprot:8246901-Alexandrium_andersonii.AAC.1
MHIAPSIPAKNKRWTAGAAVMVAEHVGSKRIACEDFESEHAKGRLVACLCTGLKGHHMVVV